MAKWLLLAAVVVLALWWLRRSRGSRPDTPAEGSTRAAEGERPAATGQTGAAPVQMVSCAHCGVYLPVTDAVTDPGVDSLADPQVTRHYCSTEHRKAGPGRAA